MVKKITWYKNAKQIYRKYGAKEVLRTLSFNYVLLHKKDIKMYQVIFLLLLNTMIFAIWMPADIHTTERLVWLLYLRPPVLQVFNFLAIGASRLVPFSTQNKDGGFLSCRNCIHSILKRHIIATAFG